MLQQFSKFKILLPKATELCRFFCQSKVQFLRSYFQDVVTGENTVFKIPPSDIHPLSVLDNCT